MRNFRELEIWKQAIALVMDIYSETNKFPTKERFGLVSQMTKCAVSIPSNIAEGCSRSSQKDFARFLRISLGSAFELETQLEIAMQLNYVSAESYFNIKANLDILQKRIQSLLVYVNSKVTFHNPKT